MVEQREIEKYAEIIYLKVCEDRNIKFSSLLVSVKSFYYEIAHWHILNKEDKLDGDLSKIASKMFDDVMDVEQKRRGDKGEIPRGGLFLMDEKVKRLYFNLAKWHIENI